MFALYEHQVAVMDRKSFGHIGAEGKHFLLLSNAAENSILEEQKKRGNSSFIVISKEKSKNELINNKQIIKIENFPINFLAFVEKINSNLLMQQYDFQSNITIGKYKLDLNSRIISFNRKELKLTEREIQIVLFLRGQKSQQILISCKKKFGVMQRTQRHTL